MHAFYMHAQLCPILWDTMECSPPDSYVQGIFRQEYWSGLSFPPLGYLPDPGIKLTSLACPILAGIFFTTDHPGNPFSSVQSLSCVQCFATPCTAACQASLATPTLRVYSNSCPLSWWCQPTISSSVVPFSSHLQSFPASGYFQMSQFFTSGGNPLGNTNIP